MFDFEKLIVYKKAKKYNITINNLLKELNLDRTEKDQLKRASLSIMLNIAEGSGRYTKPDKRRFYVISRGSVFECVAIIDYLHDLNYLNKEQFIYIYNDLEELSRILYSLINK